MPIFYQEKHSDKVIVDMPDDSMKSDGTHYATEEKLRTFWSTNDIYDAIKLKFSENLVLILRFKKKIQRPQRQN